MVNVEFLMKDYENLIIIRCFVKDIIMDNNFDERYNCVYMYLIFLFFIPCNIGYRRISEKN